MAVAWYIDSLIKNCKGSFCDAFSKLWNYSYWGFCNYFYARILLFIEFMVRHAWKTAKFITNRAASYASHTCSCWKIKILRLTAEWLNFENRYVIIVHNSKISLRKIHLHLSGSKIQGSLTDIHLIKIYNK